MTIKGHGYNFLVKEATGRDASIVGVVEDVLWESVFV